MACDSQTSQTNYLHIFAAMLLNEHIRLNIYPIFPSWVYLGHHCLMLSCRSKSFISNKDCNLWRTERPPQGNLSMCSVENGEQIWMIKAIHQQ